MNNFPPWWCDTITVYNKYEDPTTRVVSWFKTTLSNCFWKYSDEKLIVGSTKIETNQITCRVPVNSAFLEKYEWDKLSSANKATHFTFGPGDIIVKGTVTDTIDEYTAGKRSTDLITKYKKLQGCMTVNHCIVNVGGGRGNEHYHVKGL